jgi:hypothetical protein
MLHFDGKWRFETPGAIPNSVVNEFSALVGKVAAQGDRKRLLEPFKTYFANAAGLTSNWSSDVGRAETDLGNYMRNAAENAPMFIEAFYDACEALHPTITVPDVVMINRILSKCESGYEIQPPNLISRNPQHPIAVAERATSLDEQAQEIVQQSLKQSEELLSEGRTRQAVQEVLWLLETVSTSFQGLDTGSGTVQGKYFNKIAQDLRRHHKGKALDRVLSWTTTLHGYLSSPTGGGVRHGADLKSGIAMQHNEALLFCNLIRSYISFLMAEYDRLSKESK